jgi:hypothetical protein
MIKPTTISQICHELAFFQQAIDNKDWIITYQYLTMIFDDVSFDDKDFVFSITENINDDSWGITALDFLTVSMTDNPKFIIFKIFERDDIWGILENIRNVIMAS